MSAAKAICDHLHDWWHGTKPVSYPMNVTIYLLVLAAEILPSWPVGASYTDFEAGLYYH